MFQAFMVNIRYNCVGRGGDGAENERPSITGGSFVQLFHMIGETAASLAGLHRIVIGLLLYFTPTCLSLSISHGIVD